jgi:hypothetical protein
MAVVVCTQMPMWMRFEDRWLCADIRNVVCNGVGLAVELQLA